MDVVLGTHRRVQVGACVKDVLLDKPRSLIILAQGINFLSDEPASFNQGVSSPCENASKHRERPEPTSQEDFLPQGEPHAQARESEDIEFRVGFDFGQADHNRLVLLWRQRFDLQQLIFDVPGRQLSEGVQGRLVLLLELFVVLATPELFLEVVVSRLFDAFGLLVDALSASRDAGGLVYFVAAAIVTVSVLRHFVSAIAFSLTH